MSVPKLPGLTYGPPAQLDYSEPEFFVVSGWGAGTWDRFHQCTVRHTPVNVFGETIVSNSNRCYRKCQFPDGRVMVVNEGNIRIKKVKANGLSFQ